MIPFLLGANSFGGAIITPWEQLLGVTIAPRNDYYSLGFDPPNGTTNPERGAATGAPHARFQRSNPSIGATKIRRRSATGRTSAWFMPCGLACGLGQAKPRARRGKCCLSLGLIEISQQSIQDLGLAHSKCEWCAWDTTETSLRGHVEKKQPSARPYEIRRRSVMGPTSAMFMPCGLACALEQAKSRARLGNVCFSIGLIEIRQQSIQGLAPAHFKSELGTCDASEASLRSHVEKIRSPSGRIKCDDDRQRVVPGLGSCLVGLLAAWDKPSPEPVLENVASPSG